MCYENWLGGKVPVSDLTNGFFTLQAYKPSPIDSTSLALLNSTLFQ